MRGTPWTTPAPRATRSTSISPPSARTGSTTMHCCCAGWHVRGSTTPRSSGCVASGARRPRATATGPTWWSGARISPSSPFADPTTAPLARWYCPPRPGRCWPRYTGRGCGRVRATSELATHSSISSARTASRASPAAWPAPMDWRGRCAFSVTTRAVAKSSSSSRRLRRSAGYTVPSSLRRSRAAATQPPMRCGRSQRRQRAHWDRVRRECGRSPARSGSARTSPPTTGS